MAVAYDSATNSVDLSNQTSGSWSHTTSGTNRYLIVGLSGWDSADSFSGASVTYNGQALSYLGGDLTAGNDQVALYGLALDGVVAAGTFTVSVTGIVAGFAELGGGSVSFNGVAQTSSTGSAVVTFSGASTISYNVTAQSNGMVVDVLYANTGGGADPSANAGQTRVVTLEAPPASTVFHPMSYKSGSGTVSMGWSGLNVDTYAVALALNPYISPAYCAWVTA